MNRSNAPPQGSSAAVTRTCWGAVHSRGSMPRHSPLMHGATGIDVADLRADFGTSGTATRSHYGRNWINPFGGTERLWPAPTVRPVDHLFRGEHPVSLRRSSGKYLISSAVICAAVVGLASNAGASTHSSRAAAAGPLIYLDNFPTEVECDQAGFFRVATRQFDAWRCISEGGPASGLPTSWSLYGFDF